MWEMREWYGTLGSWELAAETIYKERCIAVDDGDSWAKYMSISGSAEDEHDIITLQYTEEGLLTIDENRDGRAAAFGDDIAIECLATEFKREVFVVQAHGTDAMVDEDNCVFFLPHLPRGEICDVPIFLFMKGTGAGICSDSPNGTDSLDFFGVGVRTENHPVAKISDEIVPGSTKLVTNVRTGTSE
ncbi:hypothetical protein TRIUR3_05437 [Triticum urartu]|uniref:Uncharacterized protein n=1 Tax=Triticum urartu TaxID=4572 RepID=M7YX63_TRIUA|nr:hypothetical protein TRIUR3_05437 [Triticum urartu]